MNLKDITRTEVYFTSLLHYTAEVEKKTFENFLKKKIPNINKNATIADSCNEFCFFRDLSFASKLPRQNASLEKQTFDNVFIFSDRTLVILEAKANQSFKKEQITNLVNSKELISALCANFYQFQVKKVCLIALISSKYHPKKTTLENFDAVLTWSELAEIFSSSKESFLRADSLYNDRGIA